MKKIFFIAITSISFLFGMNHDRSMRILLNNNGTLLKNLITNEKSGNCISELLAAEKMLPQFWDNITPKERSTYNKETQELIQCIINRPQARKELFKVVKTCQHKKIHYIVKKNPYVIHAYGYQCDENDNDFSCRVAPILEYAVIKNCKKCVKEVLAQGANVNAVNRDNKTALFSAESIDIFDVLRSAGAFSFLSDYQQRSLLHCYVKKNNVACMNRLVYQSYYTFPNNENINAADKKGNTALHKAMKPRSPHSYMIVKILLDKKASLDILNNKAKTPLDLAVLYGDQKIEKVLKDYGCLFYHFNRVVGWKNPYDLLTDNASYFKLISTLSSVSISNKALAKFFIFLYCNEKKNKYESAVIKRIDNAFVIKNATFKEVRDYFGKKVINSVKAVVDKFIVEYVIDRDKPCLLEELSNTSFSLNVVMPDALHYAINKKNYFIIPLLLNLGSDFTYCDKEGRTPLQNVEAQGDQRLVVLFKQYLTEHLWQTMRYADKHKEVNLLFQQGADPHQSYDSIEGSLFHHDLYNHGCYAQELINAGVDVHKGLIISPLRLAVKMGNFNYLILLLQNGARTSHDMEKIWLDILHKRKIDVIKAFIEKGVLVNNKSLENDNNTEEIKNILSEAYKNQECCVCFEHNDDLSYIPCKNIHANDFLCKRCYDDIKPQENKLCPLCRKVMNKMLSF